MRIRSYLIITLIAAFAVLGGVRCAKQARNWRVVGKAVATDGTEMCIIQKFNWGAEPFTTQFVFRKKDGPWESFYYDHQDIYWTTSRATVDTNAHRAVFFRGDTPAVTFDWESATYILHRMSRTNIGGQSPMPAGFDLPI